MPFLDFLVNEDEIMDQMEQSNQAARERFDPSQLDPQLDVAQQQAKEGLPDENIRTDLVNNILSTHDSREAISFAGGNPARALSFLDKINQQKQGALAQAERKIGIADEKAKMRGRENVGSILSQQKQLEAQRDAEVAKNRAMAEAEAERRKSKLGSTVGKALGVGASFIPGVGPLASMAIGTGSGLLFGGGEGAVSAATTGASTAMDQQFFQDQMNQEENSRSFFDELEMFRMMIEDTQGTGQTLPSANFGSENAKFLETVT